MPYRWLARHWTKLLSGWWERTEGKPQAGAAAPGRMGGRGPRRGLQNIAEEGPAPSAALDELSLVVNKESPPALFQSFEGHPPLMLAIPYSSSCARAAGDGADGGNLTARPEQPWFRAAPWKRLPPLPTPSPVGSGGT